MIFRFTINYILIKINTNNKLQFIILKIKKK